MKKFKATWKVKANSKDISAADMVAYAVLRAAHSKEEDKKALAEIFINKAFTPAQFPKKYATKDYAKVASIHATKWAFKNNRILGESPEDVFENIEALEAFSDIVASL